MNKKISISIILCLFALVLSMFGIGLYRTVTFEKPDIHFEIDNKTFEVSKTSLLNLSKAIQTPAISNKDYQKTDFKQFDNFLTFLKTTYPIVFSKLEYIKINNYSILLIWHTKQKTDNLPVLITGHYDTVGVDKETINDWKYPPYGGKIAEDKIWGRGTLDDRASLIAIFEAVNSLLSSGFEPKSDVYFAFGHDEETGGINGAKNIAKYLEENKIKFEIVLDEGGRVETEPNGRYSAYIGISEKGRYAFDILVKSKGGHASRPLKTSSVIKMGRMVQILNDNQMSAALSPEIKEYYNQTFSKYDFYTKFLIANSDILKPLLLKKLADSFEDNANIRTTTAFTMLEGAPASNIIPDIVKVTGDFRIIPSQNYHDIEKHIKNVMQKNAPDIEYEIKPFFNESPSGVSPVSNDAFKKLGDEILKIFPNAKIIPFMVTGGTDARQYEKVSNSIYRFLPMILEPEDHALMHSVNENVSVQNYARAIEFYKNFIMNFYQ